MKISVVIATYNSAKFIAATIESVFRQTLPPDEILVLDDGSKDDTVSILNTYGPRVTVFQQANRGAAAARNELCKRASGDLIAFLDHDDIWHPKYLEAQYNSFLKNPLAVAFFTGHVDFNGAENYFWKDDIEVGRLEEELIAPVDFFRRYNQATGPFASMSYCCVPKAALERLGNEPFHPAMGGVEDSYLLYLLCLQGPVSFTPMPLAAYRIWGGSLSQDRVKSLGLWVKVFELLYERYRKLNDPKMLNAFRLAFALKRRRYGKLLMGSGRTSEARRQFCEAVRISDSFSSRLKSLALWLLTVLPAKLQPAWPSGDRESGDKTMNFHRSRRAAHK
jgi:glycosyltransferase involved in cell wall biosynthesis